MKISILLATYNSSKYLRAQLDSLFAQTEKKWDLVIRDDGSSDDTIEIIHEYQAKFSNVHLIQDGDRNLGPKVSFMRLLAVTEADYYFFCDHDDVWMPTKIESSLKLMISTELEFSKSPVIVHTDLTVADQDLNIISDSFWNFSKIQPKILENKNLIQVFNCVTGCTMVCNHRVKDIAFPYPSSIPMHDWWLALNTLRYGGVIKHVPESTILYRQHMSNEVGARKVGLSYFRNKMRNIFSTLRGQKQILDFLNDIEGLNFVQYYFYKILYTIQRNY